MNDANANQKSLTGITWNIENTVNLFKLAYVTTVDVYYPFELIKIFKCDQQPETNSFIT